MKKLMPIISGMGLSLLLGVLVGHVTLAEDTESLSMVDLVLERHCTDVAKESGEECITNTYSNDHKELKKLADSDAGPFHNLYLFTYQNIYEAPQEAAIQYLADIEDNYSKSDLESILIENDLSKLYKETLTQEEVDAELEELDRLEEELAAAAAEAAASSAESGVSVEFLSFQAQSYYIDSRRRALENNDPVDSIAYQLQEYGILYEKYTKELDYQNENRKLAYMAYASEIFFDNDLGNSGKVDILHDLDLINFLMFGEFIIYPDREEGGDVELSSEDFIAMFAPVIYEEEAEVLLAAEDAEIDPYACLEDETLREALDDFEEYTETEPTSAEPEAPSYEPEPDAEPETEEEEEEREETDTTKEDFDDFIDQLATNQGDWTRGLPCGEIFCITVNLVKGTWGTTSGSQGEFEQGENCIACHLDYIAAATDETLSGGVHPNKVSQNWFEDGTCKDVGNGLNLDFNVYAVPVPIELDPGDDTDDLANEQYEDTVKAWVEWSYLNNINSIGKSPAEFEQDTYLNNLKLSGTPLTAQEILEELTEIESNKSDELEAIMTGNDIQVKVESSYNLYSQMAAEFQTMLLYFTNFSDWIKDSYVTDTAPLNKLLQKPYCP